MRTAKLHAQFANAALVACQIGRRHTDAADALGDSGEVRKAVAFAVRELRGKQ